MVIESTCAVSGRPLRMELDQDLNLLSCDPGSNPIISIPNVNLVKTKEPCIIDIF
jgi:hypothetical protein